MSSDSSGGSPGGSPCGRSRSERVYAASGLAALLTAACIGENPIDASARVEVFGLLGGLELGEALTVQGTQAQRISLPGAAEGVDYVVIPFLGSEEDVTVTVGIQGATLLDALGPPAARVPSGGAPFLGRPGLAAETSTARLHERLRRSEIRRLEPSLRSMRARTARVDARGSSAPPARVPVVGEILTLRTLDPSSSNPCDAPLERTGRVAVVTGRAIVVSDTESPVELGAADLAAIASEFDALVHPVGVESFGDPTDIDANERIIVFFTPVVNDAEAAGFFFAGDLFSSAECAASNEAEIVYILSPDPSGETALPVSYDVVARIASGVIAHELQHLINAARRVYVNGASQFESIWLNEGLSHIAEELTFYEATSFGPGENLDIEDLRAVVDLANRFIVGNLFFYASYAADPTAADLSGDATETRGAIWAFLRYAADREGRPDAELFHDLVNSTTTGLPNLDRVLVTGGALEMMQAWTASVFSDDHLEGAPDFLTQPSWDFRSILPELEDDGSFPLDLQGLQAGGGPVDIALSGGGAAFFRIRVGAARTGELRLDVGGSPAGALRVTVIRSR